MTMTPTEYQALAMSKEADQERIRERVYNHGLKATRIENASRGLQNESGEIADIVKGWLEYGRELDEVGLLEEAGDVLWRVSQLLIAIGKTLNDAMEANLRKLDIRFDSRCVDHHESDRNRPAERAAMGLGVGVGMAPRQHVPMEQNGHGWAEPAEEVDA